MSEHDNQACVIAWARLSVLRWPELRTLHAVQNWAGVKSPREGARRKAEGVEAGVPDLHLPVARGEWSSLYIEMKRERMVARKRGGYRVERTKPTDAQTNWHALLREYGNAVAVCWTAEEAETVLESYLRGTYAQREAA